MKLLITKATTSKVVPIFIQDSSSTTGAGLAGLVFNSASLSAFYYREGAGTGGTAITLATMTIGTWATGGFVEIDAADLPGHYELSLPDAVLATGADWVIVQLKGATNMAPVQLEIQLTDLDVNVTIADQVWDEPNTGADHNVNNSTGKQQRQASGLITGLAQAGTASTVTLPTSAPAVNSVLNGSAIAIIAGTGAGQHAIVTAYVGSTRVATIAPDWVVTPDATSELTLRTGRVNIDTVLLAAINALVSGAVDADVSAIQAAAITLASIASGAIGSVKFQSGAITDTVMGDGSLTELKFAAGAITPTVAPNLDAAITTRTKPADLGFPEINQAFSDISFLMVLASDNVTPVTGLTVTAERSINGAAFEAAGGVIAEIGRGIYQFDATAADMNGRVITFRFSAATAADRFQAVVTRSAP